MDLINCKIGILLEDFGLSRRIAKLLRQDGAIVHCAVNDEEMENLLDNLDLDIAIVGKPQPELLYLN